MSHLSQTLERLIEIISVEKLVGLIEKNTNTNINEIPIISPKPNITVKDYSDDIAKIQEQLVAINSSLFSLSEAIKNVVIRNNECRPVADPDANSVAKVVEEEHIRLNIEEKICCLPTVAHAISETVNIEDITDKEEEEDVSDNEVEDEEEDISETEVEAKEEDVVESEAEEEAGVESEEEAKEEEEEAEVEEESEPEVEEESEPEVGVESEEEEIEEDDVSDNKVEAKVESKEDEEEEVFEIEIDDVTYYATSEENGILYAVDKDGEVGKQVGIIKDGEPIFS